MHDEKNRKEAAVITVASKKDTKERGNIMENKKKSFNFKKFKKDVQGITLIALVVTIIVLLILAGIALNLTIGQNGIFSRAQTATNTWRNAENNEQLAMGELEDWMDGYLNGNGGSQGGGSSTEEKWFVQKFEKAQEDNCPGGDACTDPENHIHVGDYVTNFNNTSTNTSTPVNLSEEQTGVEGTQTYQYDSTTTWRVLGIRGSGDSAQLILTTGSPIKRTGDDPYLHLEGAEGWYNTDDSVTENNILDEISGIYNNSLADEVRSMRIEDINNLLGITVGEDGKIYKGGTQITASQSFIGYSQTYGQNNNRYAPENYLKEIYPDNEDYQRLTTKYEGDTVDGSAYMYMVTDPSVIDSSSKLYEVLFDGTTSSGYSKAYWLASFGVSGNGSDCRFGPGYVVRGVACDGGGSLFDSSGSELGGWYGVRPVAYLKSTVSEDDLIISRNGTEEEWTTTINTDDFQSKKISAGRVTARP